jgi:hypothetical protein
MSITNFKRLYRGSEIYVFASGASLDYIPASYFDNKNCIATNRVGMVYGLKKYITCTHHYEIPEYYRSLGDNSVIIAPDRDINNLDMEPIPDSLDIFRFPATQQHYLGFDVEKHFPEDKDTLVVGTSGVHTSLHLAQYMGAETIIIVGLDQGLLDGETNFNGYDAIPNHPDVDTGKTPHSFSVWEMHTRAVVTKIRSLGCNVFSLNPFMNWNLEGHEYSGYQL